MRQEQTDFQYRRKAVRLEQTEMCVVLHSTALDQTFSLSQAISVMSQIFKNPSPAVSDGLGKDVILLPNILVCIRNRDV